MNSLYAIVGVRKSQQSDNIFPQTKGASLFDWDLHTESVLLLGVLALLEASPLGTTAGHMSFRVCISEEHKGGIAYISELLWYTGKGPRHVMTKNV